MNPGTYTYKEDMGLADLILEAGGFKKDTYNVKYEIARIDPNTQRGIQKLFLDLWIILD